MIWIPIQGQALDPDQGSIQIFFPDPTPYLPRTAYPNKLSEIISKDSGETKKN